MKRMKYSTMQETTKDKDLQNWIMNRKDTKNLKSNCTQPILMRNNKEETKTNRMKKITINTMI